VSESPLAAMHRGDAAAILWIRMGVRACERGGRTWPVRLRPLLNGRVGRPPR